MAFPDVHERDEPARRTLDFTSLSAERILVLFAAASALGFGVLSFVLSTVGEPLPPGPFLGYSAIGSSVFILAVDAVFGVGLLLGYHTMQQRQAEGSILALAFSIVLLAFGGLPGMIAGILGLVGALTGVVRNMRLA